MVSRGKGGQAIFGSRYRDPMTSPGITLRGPQVDRADEVLTPEALDFVADLHRRFSGRRAELLAARGERRAALARGAAWTSSPGPPTSARATGASRRCRPTSATGASRSPGRPSARWRSTRSTPAPRSGWPTSRTPTPRTGRNVVGGQVNLSDAVRRTIAFTSAEGKAYALRDPELVPVIVPRPRGWHLDEGHLLVDGEPVAGALVDFGLYFFHNAARAARPRQRAVLLPAEDGVAPRGPAVGRRVHARAGSSSGSRTAPSARPC